MKAFKLLIAPVVLSVCCATAQADLVLEQIGEITLGNSWTSRISVLNLDVWDLLVVDIAVAGDTFEASPVPPIVVTAPVPFVGAVNSPTQVSAAGSIFSGSLVLDLTFNGLAAPPTLGDIVLTFSAFEPLAQTASIAGTMVWDPLLGPSGAFSAFPGATPTTQTRSEVVSTPVPGAVFLGMMGFGLMGLARKRLR